MKTSGPIIMSHFSISPDAYEYVHSDGLKPPHAHCGENVAHHVVWSEKHGDTETWTSALWKQIAPNIWQDMLQKK